MTVVWHLFCKKKYISKRWNLRNQQKSKSPWQGSDGNENPTVSIHEAQLLVNPSRNISQPSHIQKTPQAPKVSCHPVSGFSLPSYSCSIRQSRTQVIDFGISLRHLSSRPKKSIWRFFCLLKNRKRNEVPLMMISRYPCFFLQIHDSNPEVFFFKCEAKICVFGGTILRQEWFKRYLIFTVGCQLPLQSDPEFLLQINQINIWVWS